MPAISVSIGTIYAYNLDFLNSFLTLDDHFQGVLKIFEIVDMFGPLQIRLQAYMVPIVIHITSRISEKLHHHTSPSSSP